MALPFPFALSFTSLASHFPPSHSPRPLIHLPMFCKLKKKERKFAASADEMLIFPSPTVNSFICIAAYALPSFTSPPPPTPPTACLANFHLLIGVVSMGLSEKIYASGIWENSLKCFSQNSVISLGRRTHIHTT